MKKTIGVLMLGLVACSGPSGSGAGGGSGGSTGGGTGGSTGGGTGGAGGSAGGSAGGMVDPCLTAAHDAVLGTLTATSAAHVAASGPVPNGLVTLVQAGGKLYGLFDDKTVKSLGALPGLDAGATFAEVTSPADRSATVFLGSYLAGTDRYLLTGYTKSGAGFPGSVALIDTTDAGVSYVSAPGNFSAAGFSDGFAVNGGGLGAGAGSAIYMLNTTDAGMSTLATYLDGGSSGFTAVAGNGALLLGYAVYSEGKNTVRGSAPTQYSAAVSSGTPFALSAANIVAEGTDLLDVSTFGDDALVVHGGFTSSFAQFVNKIERVPLTVAAGNVTTGTAVTLFTSTNECTGVVFDVRYGNDLLLGIKDKNGTRFVRLTP